MHWGQIVQLSAVEVEATARCGLEVTVESGAETVAGASNGVISITQAMDGYSPTLSRCEEIILFLQVVPGPWGLEWVVDVVMAQSLALVHATGVIRTNTPAVGRAN